MEEVSAIVPASVFGRRMQLSPSLIATFRDCARKWAWEATGVAREQSESAARGERVHALLERWLTEGAMDPEAPEAKIAMVGLKHLPEPKTPGLQVEQWIALSIQGDTYRGRVDVRVRRPGERSIIIDHKTTSDLKWAKTPSDLEQDEQAIIYALAEMIETNAPDVELRWVYYETRADKPRSRKVSLIVTAEQAVARFREHIAPTVERMRAAADFDDPKSLPPNVSACAKFGGCPYENKCNLTPEERMKALMTQQSLAEKLRAKFAPTSTPAENTAAPAPTPAPAAEAPAPTPAPAAEAPAPTPAPAAEAQETPAEAAPAAAEAQETPAEAAPAAAEVTKAPRKPRLPKINPPEKPAESIGEAAKAAAEASPAPLPAAMQLVANIGEVRREVATQLMAASIMRGEHHDDEKERARVALSRADALLSLL